MTPRVGVVAAMQPYLYPYAGYFRLLAAAETFVILDEVQFARRGRVHRCQLPAAGAQPRWLTLPLARQPREVLIKDLAFSADARAALDARLARLPWLGRAQGPLAAGLRDQLQGPLTRPLAFLEAGLRFVAGALGLPARIVLGSRLGLDPALRGEARIVAIAEALGARTYVNAPGGRALYDAEAFGRRGVALRFLTPYAGRFGHLLPALATQDPALLRADVLETTHLVQEAARAA